jgi:hypothetical protein
MEFSELTNIELKSILRENQVKNYSKLNKKDLVKKLNQLIKAQNGGNSGKRNNRKNGKKKYKLKQLIGGGPPGEPGTPADSTPNGVQPAVVQRNNNIESSSSASATATAPPQNLKKGNQILQNDEYMELNRKNNAAKNAAQIEEEQSQTSNNLVTSENGNQAANTKNDEKCKACTIL